MIILILHSNNNCFTQAIILFRKQVRHHKMWRKLKCFIVIIERTKSEFHNPYDVVRTTIVCSLFWSKLISSRATSSH